MMTSVNGSTGVPEVMGPCEGFLVSPVEPACPQENI